MWSAAISAILTTLRYLAPATLLTLFWGQQSFLFKLLKHIDSAFRAIVFSSEEQKQDVLQWLSNVGPVRVTQLDTIWRHGWIICGVLDAALPGACAGHPPTKLSLKHAQAIADHYLGVEPVFSRQELESNDSLSKHQEWKLATYLDRIREALTKITPPVSKPTSQRTSPEAPQFTVDYVAKGSGLSAAQVNNKMCFKIYPTAQQTLDPGEITILIRGPKDTYGMAVLPPILGKTQLIRQKLLGLQSKSNYTETALPITQGATYLRNYGKNDMNKTYYIPKTKYDIEIENEMRPDHVKVTYIAPYEGRYEIFITSRGQNIAGSPFLISASHNIISLLEKENYTLEDGEEIDIVDVKTDRKVVLRIVDFVTEKMLLRENGSLEKITDDEAKVLMTTNTVVTTIKENKLQNESQLNENRGIERFKNALQKVIKMNQVCKVWTSVATENRFKIKENMNVQTRNSKDIPDVVNSTFTDSNLDPYIIRESRDKFIIPENISVSILTEKCQPKFIDNKLDNKTIMNEAPSEMRIQDTHQLDDSCSQDSLEDYNLVHIVHNDVEDDMLKISPSPNKNPFLHDIYDQNYKTEKELGSFVTNEYETNNVQNEETECASIKIIVEENDSLPPINNNPFLDINLIERPKSPVFKIISGEIKSRGVSPVPLDEEEIGNEFINPFFVHQHHQTNELVAPLPIADFIIGAPVSLPPLLRASSPVPEMESLLINEETNKMIHDHESDEETCEFSTPLHTNISKVSDINKIENYSVSSTFHSLDDTNTTETINNSNELIYSNNQLETCNIDSALTSKSVTPKRDIWDSAYVSIDDNNISPDSNNNNNNENTPLCEAVNKQKFSPSDTSFGLGHDEISNMGPAEREIWQTCNELKENILLGHEDIRLTKIDLKRPMFTPIIEESDRSLSSGIKDTNKSVSNTKNQESDTVTVAFAELNEIYQEYFPTTDKDSSTNANEKDKHRYIDVEKSSNKRDYRNVDSASEIEADVKRQTTEIEGKISEVQANVTESVSVSQTLRKNQNNTSGMNIKETFFGEKKTMNIVLERKKYWDERIRQIEAKSEESTTHQKKRRLSSRNLRNNDSLTKRRGKQIVKNFLNAEQAKDKGQEKKEAMEDIVNRKSYTSTDLVHEPHAELKLVDKWKNYWDNKLATDNNENESLSCFRAKSSKSPKSPASPESLATLQPVKSNEDIIETYKETESKTSVPVKHELPEEVFKAFETSPKRFFGTSRKQILSKIDTFLGKPSTVDESSKDVIGASKDNGLVSSRISMFHKISNTEDVSWSRRKCQSMNNIYHRKNSEKSLPKNEIKSEIIMEQSKDLADLKIDIKNKVEEDTIKMDKQQTLKDKRAQLGYKTINKSLDETTLGHELDDLRKQNNHTKRMIHDLNKHEKHLNKYKKSNELRKTSLSRSEMDIFNKADKKTDDDLEKYKSCDELPKINVKNFISLYESVSSTTKSPTSVGHLGKPIFGSQKQIHDNSSSQGAETTSGPSSILQTILSRSRTYTSSENMSIDSGDTRATNSFDIEHVTSQDKETIYVSLSDIELEIIESPDKSKESTPEKEVDTVRKDYKSRFKKAKEFFQSLEDIGPKKKPSKLNECQALLHNTSNESLESNRPKKRQKVGKSHSMPSSEFAKIWIEMKAEDSNRLVKISEKFNVDDLFTDVTEGKFSRQGSLRGIPHKKAVLEAFRSMENVSDSTMSPYELAVTQLNDFAKEKHSKTAQTYLSEYPYLPKTDPSKYHSRLDTKASGLISLKELKDKKRPRRNSVPDLRLNPTFTADL